MRGTKEFYELQFQFEKDGNNLLYGYKVERETEAKIKASVFYTDGHVNQMFHAYMMGYALKKSIGA